jgi:Flp pilus assembly protein TadG
MSLLKHRLIRSTSGNVTVIFAIALVPLLVAAGSAIDYIRFNDMRTSIQAGLDGAALAAALPTDLSNPNRIKIAKDYFRKNVSYKKMDGSDVDISVKINAESVVASVDAELKTSFMKLGGISKMVSHEVAEVMRPFAGKAEVVLVLDYSGSMDKKNKYQDMSTAAVAMIDELDAAMKDDSLKIGIVPFSAMIYTSMDREYVTQASATQTWTGCTQDRQAPYNITVDTPTNDPMTKWGFTNGMRTATPPSPENASPYDCPSYASKNLKIIPLTSDLSDVKNKITQMRPLGNTNIPLGAEFGWNLLDPQDPYTEGAAYADPKTRKFLVLLTDGVQTSSEFAKDGSRSIAQAESNLVSICKSVRDKGITVFTIAYDITNPKVTDLLKECAPSRYYEPDAGGSEIKQVFNQVTSQIKNRIARMSR